VVLVVHDIQPPGGMERVYSELIRRAAADLDVTVVSSSLAPELRPLVRWRRVRVVRRPIPLKFCCFFVLAGIEVARLRADVVHTVGAIIPNRVDVASVQHCHAGVLERMGSFATRGTSMLHRANAVCGGRLALLAERFCYRPGRVRVLAVASARVADEVRRHYPRIPVVTVPNGVDRHRMVPSPAARVAVRDDLGVDTDELVALFVGGDWQRKGLEAAIDGLGLARARGAAAWRLWVVGRGDADRYRRRARAVGVEAQVTFFGRPAEVEPLYQAADAFLLPSRYEGFSLVAVEAAACGLPIVATPVGCIDELVGEGEAGIIVDGTSAAIGAALQRLGADPEYRQRLSRGARRRAAAYSWERCVDSHLVLYQRLTAAPSPVIAEEVAIR
jgi:UDP-glucose:(heptosyl)LPS alpha-1,3-glucosyltransferase